MKQNIIKKYKWYLFGAISVVLILSIGLSFCAWDSYSIEKSFSGSSSDYKNRYYFAEDKNSNGVADVGDTVFFGDFYQGADDTVKTPIEWIVVDIRKDDNNKDVLYLLAKYMLAGGGVWSTRYYDSNNKDIFDAINSVLYNQCYNESSLRAWLNSNQRIDSSTGEGYNTTDNPRKVMNGFYNEAFNDTEKELIVPRNLGSMRGYSGLRDNGNTRITYPALTSENVWVPSMTEVVGYCIPNSDGNRDSDSELDEQFEYFKSDINNIATTATEFARTSTRSIYSHQNAVGSASLGRDYWWLRTPSAIGGYSEGVVRCNDTNIVINGTDANGGFFSNHSNMRVRPAICVYK